MTPHELRVAARDELLARKRAQREAAADELCVRGARGSLAAFMRRAWPHVEPATALTWNWHYDAMCDDLERLFFGDIRDLVICVPPGTGKSITVQAIFLAWAWLIRPSERVAVISANPRPCTAYAIKMRELLRTQWYTDLVRDRAERFNVGWVETPAGRAIWQIRKDENQKINYSNTASGSRIVVAMGGKITGDRVHGVVVDDPSDAKDVHGTPEQVSARMQSAINVYDDAIENRTDPVCGWRLVIMQRLAEHDLAGALIERGHPCIVIPMEHDIGDEWLLAHQHPRDPRRAHGEPMFPARFSDAWRLREKSKPGGMRKWLAQCQQRPTPLEGSLFRRSWLTNPDRQYSVAPERMARQMDEIAITVDCAFRDTTTADPVCMQAWGRKGADRYLLDEINARMDFPGTLAALVAFAAKWPAAKLKLVEARANGDGVIAMLRSRLPGVVGSEPVGSKYARAQIAALSYEAGQVWMPTPDVAPWIGAHIEELAAFPVGAHDDRVDAMSQLFARWDGLDGSAPTGLSALERTRALAGALGGARHVPSPPPRRASASARLTWYSRAHGMVRRDPCSLSAESAPSADVRGRRASCRHASLHGSAGESVATGRRFDLQSPIGTRRRNRQRRRGSAANGSRASVGSGVGVDLSIQWIRRALG